MKKYIIQVCVTPESVVGTCADHAITVCEPNLLSALHTAHAKYPHALCFDAYRAAKDFPHLGTFGTQLPEQWAHNADAWDVA